MRKTVIVLVGLLASLIAQTSGAADWPCFLGANRDNISTEKDLKLWSGPKAKTLWTANIGAGYATVSVAGKNVLTQGGGAVHCLDADTGQVLWTHSAGGAGAKGGKGGRGGPDSNSTPAIDGSMVYAFRNDDTLVCLDLAKGAVQWSKKASEFGVKKGGWALSGSPLIVGDNVVMDLGVVFVLNKKTGELVWKAGSEKAGYASAMVFGHGPDKLVTSFNGENLALYKLDSGQSVARYPWKTPWDVNAATPLVSGDTICITSGYGRGCTLLKLQNDGLKKVWENKEIAAHCQTPVLLDGHIYGVHGQQGDRGSLKCLDLATGAVKWDQKPLAVGGGLTLADGKLFVMVGGGELLVAEASPKGFKELARAKVLDGKCWTMPVVANGRVYCRSQAGELVCVDLR